MPIRAGKDSVFRDRRRQAGRSFITPSTPKPTATPTPPADIRPPVPTRTLTPAAGLSSKPGDRRSPSIPTPPTSPQLNQMLEESIVRQRQEHKVAARETSKLLALKAENFENMRLDVAGPYIEQLGLGSKAITRAAEAGDLPLGKGVFEFDKVSGQVGIHFDAAVSKGRPMPIETAMMLRSNEAKEAGNTAFIGDMLLMQEAFGFIKMDFENLDKDGFPEITDLTEGGTKPFDPDWEKVAGWLAKPLEQKPDFVTNALVASIGGPWGLAAFGAVTVGGQIPIIRNAVASFRAWEIQATGVPTADFLEARGVPAQATTLIKHLAVPSSVLFAVPFLTRGQANAKLSTVKVAEGVTATSRLSSRFGYAALLAQEGGALGIADMGTIAWAQGRDMTTQELILGLAMGAGGEVGLGLGLPVLAKAVGGTILKIPGGRMVLRVTGDKLAALTGRANRGFREQLLSLSTLTRKDFANLIENVTNIPRKTMAKTGVGEGGYMLHGTSGNRMVSIVKEGIQVGKAGEVDIPGVYLTSDFDTAATYARTTAKIDNEMLGEVISYKISDDVTLIEKGSDAYKAIVHEGPKALEGQNLVDALKREGYGGLYTPEVGAGKLLTPESAVIFDPANLEFVGRVVDTNTERTVELATGLFKGEITTVDHVLVGMDFDHLSRTMDDLISGEIIIPPGSPETTIAAIAAKVGSKVPAESGPMPSSGTLRWVDSAMDMLDKGPWKKLAERIANNELDRRILFESMVRTMNRPIPKGVFSTWVTGLKDNILLSPGVTKATRTSFLEASFYWEAMGEYINSRVLLSMGMFKKAFGADLIENPGQQVVGVKYIGPKVDPSAQYVIGTIVDILERPEFYRGLTTEMKTTAKMWGALLDADARLTKAAGVPIDLLNRLYVPHKLSDASNKALHAVASDAGGVVGSGRTVFGRKRKYNTLVEFARRMSKHDLEISLDPMELLITRLSSAARARTQNIYLRGVMRNHARFDANPRARPRIGEVTLDVPRKRKVDGAPAEGRWFVSRDISAEMSSYQGGLTHDPTIKTAEAILDTARSILLTLDMSAISIQGYSLFSANPGVYLRNIGHTIPALLSREGYMLFMASNAHRFARFAQAGGTLYTSAIDTPARRSITGLRRPPLERLPILGTFTEVQFDRLLPVMKLYNFEANLDILKAIREESMLGRIVGAVPGGGALKKVKSLERIFRDIPAFDRAMRKWAGVIGKSDYELERVAADMTNNVGGGINWAVVGRHPHFLDKFIMLTPGWLRANVGLITQAATVGSPAGVLARRFFMQQLMITAMISTTLSLTYTGEMPEFDLRDTRVLDIKRPEGTIALLRGKTYIRTIARAFGGVPWAPQSDVEARVANTWRFIEGREGQFLRMSIDLATGRDYFGNRIQSKMDYLLNSMLPIAGGAMYEALQAGASGWNLFERVFPEFMGVNFIPTQPWQLREREIQRAGEWRKEGPFLTLDGEVVTTYSDLNPDQRKEYDAWDEGSKGSGYNEEIDAAQALRDSPWGFFSEIDAAQQQRITEIGQNLLEAKGLPGSAQQYRDRLALIKTVTRILKEAERFRIGAEDREAVTLDQKIHNGYYEEVVDKSLDPEILGGMRDAEGLVSQPGGWDELFRTLTAEIDGDVFESLESRYFNFVREEYGEQALEKLKGWLGMGAQSDPITAGYARDRDVLDRGYYKVLDEYFTPENLVEAGIPGVMASAITGGYNTWEQFVDVQLRETFTDLQDKPLPSVFGNRTIKVDVDGNPDTPRVEMTWYQNLGLEGPLVPMNNKQARQAAVMVMNLTFGDYTANRTRDVGDPYLKSNPEQIAILERWEFRPVIKASLRPYLALMGVGGQFPQ